jgi:hypothetical protein
MDLFTESYEALLNEVKQEMDADRRTEQAVKMKMMLMHQAAYLMNEYICYQKMVTPPHMIREGAICLMALITLHRSGQVARNIAILE